MLASANIKLAGLIGAASGGFFSLQRTASSRHHHVERDRITRAAPIAPTPRAEMPALTVREHGFGDVQRTTRNADRPERTTPRKIVVGPVRLRDGVVILAATRASALRCAACACPNQP